ncbi:DUF2807 domain-containing protein [Dysgonomonas sp. OttesenSCG-928-M03]|nr:DUF2807 domain-containing protein [Dysgonomonas sp. OttesenSCG-928-M03]
MRISFFALLSLLLVVSCKSNPHPSGMVRGNGKVITREVPVSNYTGMELTGSCELVYEQKVSQRPYLKIEIDENLQNSVNIRQKNNILHVSLGNGNFSPTKYKIYTNSPGLARVKLSGSARVTLKGTINSTDLSLSIVGSGGVKADKLRCSNLRLAMSGSGSVSLGGEAYQSNIRLSGSGNIDALSLKTKGTNCKVSGSGEARVYASELLDAHISGSGGIRYKGSPSKINQKVSGSGKIRAY